MTGLRQATMIAAVAATACAAATISRADAPEVLSATAVHDGQYWTIEVTLRHPDTGWDHFAKGWRVETEDGSRLGWREITHPSVDEQPVTLSLEAVEVPEGTTRLLIRPKCNLSGWAHDAYVVTLSE